MLFGGCMSFTATSSAVAPGPSVAAVPSDSDPPVAPSYDAPTRAPSSAAGPPSPITDPTIGPKPPFEASDIVITSTDNVRVRSKPRVSADSRKYEPLLQKGTELNVIAGPVAASGYWWYKVGMPSDLTLDGGITAGWIAAADHDGTPWIESSDGGTVPRENSPLPDLPQPVITMTGAEDYTIDGMPFIRYVLDVANWSDYPSELFAPAPDLEPCGLNTSASRTWVDIIDADLGERMYGFCALGEPQDLVGLWFAVPKGTPPPAELYVVLYDRLTGRDAVSDPVSSTIASASS